MGELVIICGGAKAPALQRLDEIIHEEDKVCYIGVDRGSLCLLEANHQLDYAVGDFDSVTESELERIALAAKHVIQHPTMKDDTDMELALELALSQYPEASEYLIVGGLGEQGGRLDHLFANLWMAYQPRYYNGLERLVFLEDNHVVRFFLPGQHEIYPTNSLPDYLSIISLTPVKQIRIEGAKYTLSPTDISYPRALISNEFISINQPIVLSFQEGIVMVSWVDE